MHTVNEIVAIIGIGYVGLQSAMVIAKAGFQVIAFDKDQNRVEDLSNGIDKNGEVLNLDNPHLLFTDDPTHLKRANFYIISVPTPINNHLVPDLYPLKCAAKVVAGALKSGDVVVLESTVFPGATRELFIPILEQLTGLKCGDDFHVGYSSERIVPGDATHTLANSIKVISGYNDEALHKIKELYQKALGDRLFCAANIETAEASKLLENIQRDVNIALMNEYAQIMDKIGVSMHDVLDAASTKWNFVPFKPGLVGGHCIPIDPYYLIYQANKLGVPSHVISSARQTNEQFSRYIVDVIIKKITQQGVSLAGLKLILMGVSFKPNVSDTRHSLTISLSHALKFYGINVQVFDPIANRSGLDLNWIEWHEIQTCHALVICQAHDAFLKLSSEEILNKIAIKGILIDIPGILTKQVISRDDVAYWSL